MSTAKAMLQKDNLAHAGHVSNCISTSMTHFDTSLAIAVSFIKHILKKKYMERTFASHKHVVVIIKFL